MVVQAAAAAAANIDGGAAKVGRTRNNNRGDRITFDYAHYLMMTDIPDVMVCGGGVVTC
jgi:hypothetical protein